jgi:hypothetical protein
MQGLKWSGFVRSYSIGSKKEEHISSLHENWVIADLTPNDCDLF